MIEWLIQPLDPSRPHEISDYVAWHGRLMVLAWGVLAPLGVLIARFYKVTPAQDWPRELDNPTWWHWHLRLQISAAVVAFAGIVLIVWRNGGIFVTHWHSWLGWAVLSLLGMQVFSGILRGSKGGPTALADDGSWRGDHFDMTTRRVVFEVLHKTVGYGAILLSVLAIVSGLWLVNAPRWMWLSLAGWWCVLGWAFVALQSRGRCVDTYQAIWGADPNLPGNRLPPIGPGIKRPP